MAADPKPYPSDFARCQGRRWSEDEFLAAECQGCGRWLARFIDSHTQCGAVVAHIVPPRETQCPMRVKAEA